MSHNGRVAPGREELLVLVPAFAGTTAGELGIGPRGRRAAVLWPGLSRAALLVCPLHLGVGPINGDQADCVGRPPPGSTRRPGERLVFRLGEIEDDALVSLFDCQPNPPPVCAGFAPILALGGPCGGGAGLRRIQSLIYIICSFGGCFCKTNKIDGSIS